MFSDVYSVRPISTEDLETILDWRNSDRIHSIMLTEHKITWDEHINWFERISKYEPCRNFVFEYDKVPIGYIGYTEYDEINKTCSPGAYLGVVDDGVPIDAAFWLFYKTMDYAFNVLNMKKLITEVFVKNKKAVKMDKFLGFEIVKEKEVLKNGKVDFVYIMELDKKRWDLEKEKFST